MVCRRDGGFDVCFRVDLRRNYGNRGCLFDRSYLRFVFDDVGSFVFGGYCRGGYVVVGRFCRVGIDRY